jgi:hypothetical protein
MGDKLPATDLPQFIARHIGSVEQLEILCLLWGTPQKVWSVQDVFRVIQSSETSVADHLARFLKEGFVVLNGEGRFRYHPTRPEMDHCVAELVKAYQERRVAVVEMIYQRRPETLRDFANAFKLRKDK